MAGNFSRTVQLGLLASDMAAARGNSERARRARCHLIERLGKIHGLPQKVGQILSLNELEDENQAWTALTETPATVAFQTIREVVETELGASLKSVFREFDEAGIAASLSQVHRARTNDGREVAVKVQYPGIDTAIESDLRSLGWLTAPVGGLRKGFDLAAYQHEVRRILDEELDFRAEAASLRRFRDCIAGDPSLDVPEVLPEFSSRRVLTMTWLDGSHFREVRGWGRAERTQVAEGLVKLFLRSGLDWNFIHGDPHPGNLRFRNAHTGLVIGLLDFGCVRELPPETAAALRWFIHHTSSGSLSDHREEIFHRYLSAGFDPKFLEPMASRLYDLTELIFEPFRHDRPFDIAEWHMRTRIDRVLGEDRWNFRFAGPPTLIVFIRAYQGLLRYGKALHAPVNWHALYRDIAATLPKPRAAGPDARPPVASNCGPLAKALYVTVVKNGVKTVQVKFKAEAARRIDELMPDDVLRALRGRHVDLEAVKREVVASNFAPTELFTLTEGAKQVRVWLQ